MFNPLNFLTKIIKSNNQKELDRITKIVKKINDLEEQIAKLEDECQRLDAARVLLVRDPGVDGVAVAQRPVFVVDRSALLADQRPANPEMPRNPGGTRKHPARCQYGDDSMRLQRRDGGCHGRVRDGIHGGPGGQKRSVDVQCHQANHGGSRCPGERRGPSLAHSEALGDSFRIRPGCP